MFMVGKNVIRKKKDYAPPSQLMKNKERLKSHNIN